MRIATIVISIPLAMIALGWWSATPAGDLDAPDSPPESAIPAWWRTVSMPKPAPIVTATDAIARATRAMADVNALDGQALLYESAETWRVAGTSDGIVLLAPTGWWFRVDHAGDFIAASDEPSAMPTPDRLADGTLATDVLTRLAVIDNALRGFTGVGQEPALHVTAHPTAAGGWTVRGWQDKNEHGGRGWSAEFTPDGAISGAFGVFRACGGCRTRRLSPQVEPLLPVGSG